jgi:Flp pilus assembly protein TadD
MTYTVLSAPASPNESAALVDIDFDWLDMHLRQGRYDSLAAMCTTLAERSDLSPEQRGYVRFFEGMVALRRGDTAQSVECLIAASETAPAYARTRAIAVRAAVKLSDGDVSGARELVAPLAGRRPLDYATLTTWGRILLASGDESGAWSSFVEALELEPTGIDAVHQIVALGLAAERVLTLKRLLTRFIDLEPENLNVRSLLAAACLASGDDDRARRELSRITAFAGLVPLDEEARTVLETVGKTLAAKAEGP